MVKKILFFICCFLGIQLHSQVTYYQDADADTYGNFNVTIVSSTGAPGGYVLNSTDCHDGNASIHPGAVEVIADGIDQNCDGCDVCYVDTDNDNFGISSTLIISGLSCSAAANAAPVNNDCNDANATIYPGAAEIVGDGIDQNCDACDLCYADVDNDNYGKSTTVNISGLSCLAAANAAPVNTDCNDNNSTIYPGATEIVGDGIDQNCDACDVCYVDMDNDNYGTTTTVVISGLSCAIAANAASVNTDCNDSKTTIYPGAPELCDGMDNNCDSNIDEGLLSTYYQDLDGDGYGNSAVTAQFCQFTAGYSLLGGDCNDSYPGAHPNGIEYCDGIDNNCNGIIDEGLLSTFYQDLDGDGYGNSAVSSQLCSLTTGYAVAGGDCNDTDPAMYPNAPEMCDGLDNNCDGNVDEGLMITYYQDLDADGYGNNNVITQSCSVVVGYATNGGDCNDANSFVHPNAIEFCDGLDNNCDGNTDEGLIFTFYQDFDNDGYGTATNTMQGCSASAGYVSNSLDCDDSNGNISPAATEICDGIDNNCNGSTDEALIVQYYHDGDGDGYGNASSFVWACSSPFGYVTDHTDCNDANATIYPGATEIANGIDDNCDGTIDNITVGISNISNANGIYIYPNPASNQITIEVTNDFINHSYSITDILGRQIASGMIKQNSFSINLTSFATGNYVLKIIADQKVITQSFQKY